MCPWFHMVTFEVVKVMVSLIKIDLARYCCMQSVCTWGWGSMVMWKCFVYIYNCSEIEGCETEVKCPYLSSNFKILGTVGQPSVSSYSYN